jgi:hypothetical protein
MKTAVSLALGVLSIGCAVNASLAQPVDVFLQEVESGSARPLTADEKAKLQDPLFRLVLARRPDMTRLSDIEGLIQPDRSKRMIFVVDEEIRDFRQPQARRSVIAFDGTNGDLQLTGNIALSTSFESGAMPDKDTELEAWGWDEQNGVYNYYKLDRQGNTTPALSWKLRASSKQADRVTVESRAGTCLRCHTTGVPIMKELLFPWNNWHSFTSPATYLTNDALPDQRWPVTTDPNFPPLAGADTLEPLIKGAIIRFNNRKLQDFLTGDVQSGFVVKDAKILLKPLFDTTEINLESASQKSGLHPIPDPSTAGPSQSITVPDNFFLETDLLAGTNEIVGIGLSEAKGFGSVAVIQPAEYKALVEQAKLQITRLNGTSLRGDTNFAWLTPAPGFAAAHWIGTLIQQKIISRELVAAVLSVDVETPIFSVQRRKLLEFVPDTFTTKPGEAYPDTLIRSIITALLAKNPSPGSGEAEFLAVLRTASPIQELKSRVTDYRNRVAAKLNDAGTRQGELQRLFDLLIGRRMALETYPDASNFPLFGSLIESRALFPLPAPSKE